MNGYQTVKIEPLTKRLKVRLQPEAAFLLFTEGINSWWPLPIHSVGEQSAESCLFEGREGGRIYEIMEDGRQVEWGMVLVWEPFERIVFSWYPGRTPETAQEVSVEFTAIPGGTRVDLLHTGWELLGDRAAAGRQGYDFGWDFVLANYTVKAAED